MSKQPTPWTKIDQPWFENEDFLEIVLAKAHILDILDHWGIEYVKIVHDKFTHKMICPLPTHKGGSERTPSCFISEQQNSFYCYGCNSGSSIIDFIRLYKGMPFHKSVQWLSSFVGITKQDLESKPETQKKPKRDPEKTIARQIYLCGVDIREYLEKAKGKKDYEDICEWADEQFVKLDRFMEQLNDDEWEDVKAFREKIQRYIKSKK